MISSPNFKKQVLVIGARGQLGGELLKISQAHTAVKFLFPSKKELDIEDQNSINLFFEGNEIDYVINCAAYTNVDNAEKEEIKANSINNIAVGKLVAACVLHKVKLIHISTDYVFDGMKNTPYLEVDKVNPLCVYGKTKCHGEKNVIDGIDNAIIIRTSWLYSNSQNNFFTNISRLGTERNTLNIVDDQIGTPTNASDLAKVCMKFVTLYDEWSKGVEIFHYSNEGVCSWYDFTCLIFKLRGINCEVLPISSSEYTTLAKRPSYSVLSKEKIKNVLGISIPHWHDSLTSLID